MARTSNVFKLSQEADLKQVLQFMQRVNDVLKTYKSPGQKRPKKRFTQEEIKALATAMLKPEGFTSKDVIAATSYSSPAQANKFLKALEMKGLITLTSQLKKAMEPTRDPNAPETRGRKRRDAEFDISDDPMADLDALGLGGSIDLSDPLAENNNTMSELEKYIKKVIKEAKNPLAKKMKEIENQGRRAALETKLAAIDEMIEETQGRLTRIDEDNEFRDMMDKNAVKEVRKQLKELERAKAKLQKEMVKVERVHGGKKKKEVVDEDLPVAEDAVENAVDEVELEEDDFKLNESTLRFQKLAGLITESDIKKKLSLNENEYDPMAPQGGDEAERDALLAALKSQYAKNVVLDGSFGRVALFGSGYDAHPLVNATAEIDSELALLKDRGLVDTDDYDVLMNDKAAAEEIARAVKSLGGRVSYFSRAESDPKSPFYDPEIEDLEFVYSVNNKGELLGQAI
jgi:vacuolar-type H+-ATPase subunit E/Vma4